MPPSGYKPSEVSHLAVFLRELWQSFCAEYQGTTYSVETALNMEVTQITQYLCTGATDAQTGILRLTRALYKRVAQRGPASYDTATETVLQCISEIEGECLDIHVT